MRTNIIAEIGVNHNGNFALAKKMVLESKRIGVDFVKFQMFETKNLLSKYSILTKYQKKNLGSNANINNFFKKVEFNQSEFKKLFDLCNKIKLKYFATAFDIESLNFLYDSGQRIFKIPSGEIDNTPIVRHIANFKCPVIISTGLSNLKDLNYCLKILRKDIDKSNITIFHCTSSYPTPPEEVNLNSILYLKKKFKDYQLGFSDHSLGLEMPIAAITMGCKMIEKHFTLKKTYKGPDHKTSLNSQEFELLVKNIKNLDKAFGNKTLNISKSASKNVTQAKRSIYALDFIKKGEHFSEQNLITLRPSIGISPKKWDSIIGKKSNYNFKKGDLIKI